MSLDKSGLTVSEIVNLSMVNTKRFQELGNNIRIIIENSDFSIAYSWHVSCC